MSKKIQRISQFYALISLKKKINNNYKMSTAEVENISTTAVASENALIDLALTNTTSQELDRQIRLLEDTVKEFRNQISNLKKTKKEIVTLEKENNKLNKKKSKKASTGNRKGGFSQPTEILDPLADLLGVERGSSLPRSNVTSRIKDYVHAHQLVNTENRRYFLLNDTPESKALEAILDPEVIYRTDDGVVMVRAATEGKDDQPFGYFNLQRCIKHQFGKTLASPVEETTTDETTTEAAPVVEEAAPTPAKKVVKKAATTTTEAPAATAKKVVKKKIIRKKK